MGEAADAAEDVTAEFFELAGEAHDVDEWRAQIVADDIGKALNLIVGLAQVRRALVDDGLQVDVASRRRASASSRARAERRTSQVETSASSTTRPEPMPVIEAASVWLRSELAVRIRNSRSSSRIIALAWLLIVVVVLPAAASRMSAAALSG